MGLLFHRRAVFFSGFIVLAFISPGAAAPPEIAAECKIEVWEDDLPAEVLAANRKKEIECQKNLEAKWRRQRLAREQAAAKPNRYHSSAALPGRVGVYSGGYLEKSARDWPGLPKLHIFLEAGYLKPGRLAVLASAAFFTAYRARDDLTLTGGRLSVGYTFGFGLFLTAGFGVFKRSQLSETYRVGYLIEEQLAFSFFASGFRYGGSIDTFHYGAGVGAVIW